MPEVPVIAISVVTTASPVDVVTDVGEKLTALGQ
jgi:hypothetical protein